jgi:hypothetical protein
VIDDNESAYLDYLNKRFSAMAGEYGVLDKKTTLFKNDKIPKQSYRELFP